MIVLYVALGIIGLILGVLILHVLFLAALSLFVRKKYYDKPSPLYRAAFAYVVRLAMFFCNIKIKVTGREKLTAIDGKCLFVGNHRSDFDPFVTLLGLKIKELAFISKPENFKIPIFGKIVRKCLYTDIDRENAKNAIKTINRTAELIQKDVVSYFVYPEGTRSKSARMLPFHDGVFKIAQKAGAPIVVVGVRSTEKVHKNAPWKKTVVYLDVLDVIDKETVSALSSHEISGKAKETLILATEGK